MRDGNRTRSTPGGGPDGRDASLRQLQPVGPVRRIDAGHPHIGARFLGRALFSIQGQINVAVEEVQIRFPRFLVVQPSAMFSLGDDQSMLMLRWRAEQFIEGLLRRRIGEDGVAPAVHHQNGDADAWKEVHGVVLRKWRVRVSGPQFLCNLFVYTNSLPSTEAATESFIAQTCAPPFTACPEASVLPERV